MATINLGYHPELTRERVTDVFRRHFDGEYGVEEKGGLGHDLIVKKSDWTAVRVKLWQGQNGTTLRFAGFTPSLRRRLLPVLGVIGGIPGVLVAFSIMFLALRPSRKELEDEVARFIQGAPEFGSSSRPDSAFEGPSTQGPSRQPAFR